MKVIIPRRSFSKTLKELDEAFGEVEDLYGVGKKEIIELFGLEGTLKLISFQLRDKFP